MNKTAELKTRPQHTQELNTQSYHRARGSARRAFGNWNTCKVSYGPLCSWCVLLHNVFTLTLRTNATISCRVTLALPVDVLYLVPPRTQLKRQVFTVLHFPKITTLDRGLWKDPQLFEPPI